MDQKNELNQLLQKYCKRPLTKLDVVYTTSKFGVSGYQSIVKLACLQGQEYAGNLCQDVKAAEKSAAQQALLGNQHLAQAVAQPATASADKKRPAPKAALTPEEKAAKKAKLEAGENQAVTPKSALNTLVMKIIKRFLQKGETVYQCNKVGAYYQATVSIAGLPGDWGKRAWAGHPHSTKQKAEQSAAEECLKDLQSDPELSEEAKKPKGKGKGKGKYEMMMMMSQLWSMGAELPRETVVEEPVKGTVLEWKGSYGWVQPDNPIDHPASEMRGGKVYLNKKDFVGEVESVAQGQTISFKVYVDPSGLGAQEATLI